MYPKNRNAVLKSARLRIVPSSADGGGGGNDDDEGDKSELVEATRAVLSAYADD